jgi:hypothetical protein
VVVVVVVVVVVLLLLLLLMLLVVAAQSSPYISMQNFFRPWRALSIFILVIVRRRHAHATCTAGCVGRNAASIESVAGVTHDAVAAAFNSKFDNDFENIKNRALGTWRPSIIVKLLRLLWYNTRLMHIGWPKNGKRPSTFRTRKIVGTMLQWRWMQKDISRLVEFEWGRLSDVEYVNELPALENRLGAAVGDSSNSSNISDISSDKNQDKNTTAPVYRHIHSATPIPFHLEGQASSGKRWRINRSLASHICPQG